MSSVVISGDSSGTVTLQAPAVAGTSTQTLPTTTGTVLNDASCGVCRAWVNFNGTGTVAIRASFNVSSITDNGTGDYTVNFTNAMSDANYSVCGSAKYTTTLNAHFVALGTSAGGTPPTTTSVRIGTPHINGARQDCDIVCVAVFR